MAVLNDWSIRAWTGVDVPGLQVFPMETWNFRIVHIAGALILGLSLYSARAFPERDKGGKHPLDMVAYLALLPALYAYYTAMTFASQISNGTLWHGIDPAIRAAET